MNDMDLIIAKIEADLRFQKVMDSLKIEQEVKYAPQTRTTTQANNPDRQRNDNPPPSDVPDGNVY